MSSQRLNHLSKPRKGEPIPLTTGDVVLCVLCDALNHRSNAECWVCRWHGSFNRDAMAISVAWRRLEGLYEEVRLEHVTSTKLLALGDFGSTLRPRGWQALRRRLSGLFGRR